MLQRDNSLLLIIDEQERMMPAIHGADEVVRQTVLLIDALHVLGVPIHITEQYTKGLGVTVAPIQQALGDDYRPVEKLAFSACGEPRVLAGLEASGRRQVLLCGVETHVCVYQTARHLLERGYEVEVVSDAVSSRRESNYRAGLARLERLGASLTTVEMALFELMGRADIPEFRAVSRLVK